MLRINPHTRSADPSCCKCCVLWCAEALLDLCHFPPWAKAFAQVYVSKSGTAAYSSPSTFANESPQIAQRRLKLQSGEERVLVRLRELLLNGALPERVFCRLLVFMPDLKVGYSCSESMEAHPQPLYSFPCRHCAPFLGSQSGLVNSLQQSSCDQSIIRL